MLPLHALTPEHSLDFLLRQTPPYGFEKLVQVWGQQELCGTLVALQTVGQRRLPLYLWEVCEMHVHPKILRMTLALTSALVLWGHSAFAQLGPNLISNGSFETPISDNVWRRNPATWFAGQNMGGWLVTQGSVDLKRSGTGTGIGQVGQGNAYDGEQFVDLNGEEVGGISQMFIIGNAGVYRLSFAMSGNIRPDGTAFPNSPRPMRVRLIYHWAVDIYLYEATFVWNPANHPNHRGHMYDYAHSYDWHQVDIQVPYTGFYSLEFTSLYTESPYHGPIIDDVRFQLVPEPASLVALGTGLASVAWVRRRKLLRA